ncbi:hypothetical protein QBC34DRAFT_380634 [Podospora aff. communis PSN243]|uniref:General transcription and DNA repair factor IIH subunit TFB5 n=1 Tax=Podospora aff. communis PSN243 TaxID=3040156 RepID=A0AAV9GN35_9PEZI|nr:hypothetical protein QBC34DRAFT_380634 [Podospora aff. communis PSN243]
MRAAGVLITCDPAIKSIIMQIDSEKHDIIIEDLDETHLFVKENMVQELKKKVEERLKETHTPEETLPDSDKE